VSDHPEAWNLSHPDKVQEVAQAYVDAGSQIIMTNTFGANRFAFERHELADRLAEVNRLGVQISLRAAGDRVRVFGSMGPTGKMLLTGEVTEEDLQTAFAEQARAQAEAGAQGIIIETMADPEEAKLAVRAAKQTGLPVIGCMVFDSGPDRDRTMMGTTVEQAVEALVEAGADGVGSNCGRGIAGFVPICQRMRAATRLPVWVKANAGLPEMVEGRTIYRQTAAEFASCAPALVEAGADFLGGCCGTTPDFVKAVKAKLGR
jgi:methionine synthase I (cobalamin-dependent)